MIVRTASSRFPRRPSEASAAQHENEGSAERDGPRPVENPIRQKVCVLVGVNRRAHRDAQPEKSREHRARDENDYPLPHRLESPEDSIVHMYLNGCYFRITASAPSRFASAPKS